MQENRKLRQVRLGHAPTPSQTSHPTTHPIWDLTKPHVSHPTSLAPLRQVHRKMGEQVCTLMETSLLRKKSAWEEQIKKLRAQVERAARHTPPCTHLHAHTSIHASIHTSVHTSVHTSITRAGRGAAASVPGDEGVADALGHAALQGARAPVHDGA